MLGDREVEDQGVDHTMAGRRELSNDTRAKAWMQRLLSWIPWHLMSALPVSVPSSPQANYKKKESKLLGPRFAQIPGPSTWQS